MEYAAADENTEVNIQTKPTWMDDIPWRIARMAITMSRFPIILRCEGEWWTRRRSFAGQKWLGEKALWRLPFLCVGKCAHSPVSSSGHPGRGEGLLKPHTTWQTRLGRDTSIPFRHRQKYRTIGFIVLHISFNSLYQCRKSPRPHFWLRLLPRPR